MATVKRKFFYYTARTDSESVSFADMLRKLNELDDGAMAYEYAGQQVMIQLTPEDDHTLGRITILREDGIPSIGTRNTLASRLIDLRDDEGIQEASHFIFLPSKKLLAFEYNHYGPRVTVLFSAANELYGQNFTGSGETPPTGAFDYVERDGSMDRIDGAHGIKAVEATFTTTQLTTNSAAGLLDTVHQIGDIGQTKTVSVILKGEKGSRSSIMAVSDLMRRFLPQREQSLPNFDRLRVKIINPTGATELVDLFEDKVITELNVIKLGRSRAVDSNDLYTKVLADVRSKAYDME